MLKIRISNDLVFDDLDTSLGLCIGFSCVATQCFRQIVGQCLIVAKIAFLKHGTLLEHIEEAATFVGIVRHRHTIGMVLVERCVRAVLL